MITIKSGNGELNIDMWWKDEYPFEPNKYGADAYAFNDGSTRGNIYNEMGDKIGDYWATDSVLVEENFLIDFDINACDSIEGATNSEDGADLIHFYYNGQKLGDAPADDIQCLALLDLIRQDKEAATQILNYLNSLGDPVYPVSDEDWQTPETDVDNIDKADLYYTFLQELGYEYDEVDFEVDDELYTQFGDFEIFTGEEVIESSTGIKCSEYTSTNPLLVEAPRGDYYVWEEFGKFKGSVQNPNTRIVDAHKITTFDDFESLDEVVEYVKKYF